MSMEQSPSPGTPPVDSQRAHRGFSILSLLNPAMPGSFNFDQLQATVSAVPHSSNNLSVSTPLPRRPREEEETTVPTKIRRVDSYRPPLSNILRCTHLMHGEGIVPDEDINMEDGRNLKTANDSYARQLREQQRLIEQQNQKLESEKEVFQQRLQQWDAHMNERLETLNSEKSQLERELTQKNDSILALRSSLTSDSTATATSSPRHPRTNQTMPIRTHHANLPVISITSESGEATGIASTPAPTSSVASVQTTTLINMESSQLSGNVQATVTPPAPAVAGIMVPTLTQAPPAARVIQRGNLDTVQSEDITVATQVPRATPAAVIQSPVPEPTPAHDNFITPAPIHVNTPAPAPVTTSSLDKDEDFSDPDISKSDVVDALAVLMKAMKTRETTVHGRRASRKPVIRREAKLIGRAKELNCKAVIRNFWREIYDIEKHNDFFSYIPANPEAVTAYNYADGEGPADDAPLDLGEGWRHSTWNKTIMKNFMAQVKVRSQNSQNDPEWCLPSVSDEFILALLWSQLEQCQSAYHKSLPLWISSQDQYETPSEIVTRVGDVLRGSSADNFLQKFEHRTGVVTNIIALKTESGAADLKYWKFLKKVLTQLGTDGMSQEESGCQIVEGRPMQVFIVKLCEWRAPQIPKYLELIDKTAKDMAGRRSRMTTRVPSTEIDNSTDAPPNLPRSMYNAEWLKKLSRSRVEALQVSEEVFELLSVAIQRR
ncbi:hypothetical protein EV421DRAFT_1913272 [Armillaria borealis]|uniref:Uncharacterized protein n=1 Tax=Armillaria borealis TaxID=47425 RepID=A0AA39IUU6_9AGAR|nr:hypothetical protein EV421DRAFT_1913272 [Armillaria borealis]